MHTLTACAEPDFDTPTIGDVTNLADLVGTMTESLQQTLATRLGIEWQLQHPGVQAPNAYASLTVTIDFRLLQSICKELARNTAQVIAGLPVDVEDK